MKVSETVRQCLWHYPSLYRDRTHVLVQIMCDPSVGYDWVDGELIDGFADDESMEDPPVDPHMVFVGRVNQWLTDQLHFKEMNRRRRAAGYDDPPFEWRGLHRATVESWRELAEEEAARNRYVHDNIETLIEQRSAPEGITPLSRPTPGRFPSPITVIPDDVTDDWLDACEEMAQVALASSQSTLARAWDRPGYEPDASFPPPFSPESADRLRKILGKQDPTPSERAAELEHRERASEARLRADAAATEENHAIARETLERVAYLRKQRLPVTSRERSA